MQAFSKDSSNPIGERRHPMKRVPLKNIFLCFLAAVLTTSCLLEPHIPAPVSKTPFPVNAACIEPQPGPGHDHGKNQGYVDNPEEVLCTVS
jgi:hypothetical protein